MKHDQALLQRFSVQAVIDLPRLQDLERLHGKIDADAGPRISLRLLRRLHYHSPRQRLALVGNVQKLMQGQNAAASKVAGGIGLLKPDSTPVLRIAAALPGDVRQQRLPQCLQHLLVLLIVGVKALRAHGTNGMDEQVDGPDIIDTGVQIGGNLGLEVDILLLADGRHERLHVKVRAAQRGAQGRKLLGGGALPPQGGRHVGGVRLDGGGGAAYSGYLGVSGDQSPGSLDHSVQEQANGVYLKEKGFRQRGVGGGPGADAMVKHTYQAAEGEAREDHGRRWGGTAASSGGSCGRAAAGSGAKRRPLMCTNAPRAARHVPRATRAAAARHARPAAARAARARGERRTRKRSA
ncbi:hypothetical protein FGB62_259g011 [Gracilaria domingensis]|nr:hypothetical protein FGB62_259g011 [Gracilaria domingensis]